MATSASINVYATVLNRRKRRNFSSQRLYCSKILRRGQIVIDRSKEKYGEPHRCLYQSVELSLTISLYIDDSHHLG